MAVRNPLAEQFERARREGGGITPTPRDSSGNPIRPGPAPLPTPPSKSVGRIVKELGAKVLGQREHTPEEEVDFRYRGRMAYNNAKDARRINSTGSPMSPSTRSDR